MKKFLGGLLIGLSLLTGCAHQYVVKTTNGNKFIACGQPKLEKGYYIYKDAKGDKHSIAQGRVVEITAASMAGDESSNFKATKSK